MACTIIDTCAFVRPQQKSRTPYSDKIARKRADSVARLAALTGSFSAGATGSARLERGRSGAY